MSHIQHYELLGSTDDQTCFYEILPTKPFLQQMVGMDNNFPNLGYLLLLGFYRNARFISIPLPKTLYSQSFRITFRR